MPIIVRHDPDLGLVSDVASAAGRGEYQKYLDQFEFRRRMFEFQQKQALGEAFLGGGRIGASFATDMKQVEVARQQQQLLKSQAQQKLQQSVDYLSSSADLGIRAEMLVGNPIEQATENARRHTPELRKRMVEHLLDTERNIAVNEYKYSDRAIRAKAHAEQFAIDEREQMRSEMLGKALQPYRTRLRTGDMAPRDYDRESARITQEIDQQYFPTKQPIETRIHSKLVYPPGRTDIALTEDRSGVVKVLDMSDRDAKSSSSEEQTKIKIDTQYGSLARQVRQDLDEQWKQSLSQPQLDIIKAAPDSEQSKALLRAHPRPTDTIVHSTMNTMYPELARQWNRRHPSDGPQAMQSIIEGASRGLQWIGDMRQRFMPPEGTVSEPSTEVTPTIDELQQRSGEIQRRLSPATTLPWTDQSGMPSINTQQELNALVQSGTIKVGTRFLFQGRTMVYHGQRSVPRGPGPVNLPRR